MTNDLQLAEAGVLCCSEPGHEVFAFYLPRGVPGRTSEMKLRRVEGKLEYSMLEAPEVWRPLDRPVVCLRCVETGLMRAFDTSGALLMR